MRRVLRYLLPVLVILLLAACQQAPGTVLGTASEGERPNGLRLTAAPSDDLGDDGGEGDEDLPGDDDAGGDDQDGDDTDVDAVRCVNGQQPNPAAQRLAAELGVDVAEVWGWFCAGFGLGEIRIAYFLSAESGTPVADLFAMREAGMGWGQIAQELGLELPDDDDADDDADDGDDDDQDAWRCEQDGTPNPAAERLAAELDVDAAEIWEWFCQGYGLGEIRTAYTLSAESETPVADLFAMFGEGMGWGEIAKQLGLKPGNGQGNPHDEDNPTGNPHGEDNPTGNPHKDAKGKGDNPHGK